MKMRSHSGFSLVEMMVTVVILGILSTVALVSYRQYVRRVHTSEALGMLGMIRMRQETYRSEFSQYCDVSSATHDGTSGTVASHWPATAPGQTATDWNSGIPPEWIQLGVRPSGPVYFRYDVVAGNPGVTPNLPGGYGTSSNQDAWWVGHAYGDLDGDGIQSTFEASCLTTGIWIQNETE